MTIFAESLKRLYENGKVSLDKIKELLNSKKINQEEYNYITNK